MPGPITEGFWDEYRRLIQNTLDSTQKLIQNIGSSLNYAAEGAYTSLNIPTRQPGRNSSPDINVNNDNVIVSFSLDRLLTKENTQVYLEGCCLVVDGALQAKVPLPVAVLKYGGKAIAKQGRLEITLLRDKYGSRHIIPLETG